MIVDSSVLVSVLMHNAECGALIEQLCSADVLGIAAPTLVDAAMLLSSAAERDVQHIAVEFVQQAQMEVIPFEDHHFHCAVDAFRRWGAAQPGLRFQDCLTYAVAFLSDQPLLTTNRAFDVCDIKRINVAAGEE